MDVFLPSPSTGFCSQGGDYSAVQPTFCAAPRLGPLKPSVAPSWCYAKLPNLTARLMSLRSIALTDASLSLQVPLQLHCRSPALCAQWILQHFSVSPEEYTVIFTSGCTAAIKLVAESFPWIPTGNDGPGSLFCYLTDNHTSVIGIRGLLSQMGVSVLPVNPKDVWYLEQDSQSMINDEEDCRTPHLLCYPAQSNFSGTKYPLNYIHALQAQKLHPFSRTPGQWFTLLDAASFVSCSHLDLRAYPADFVTISFYKIFGFPSGLGALLVHNNCGKILKKSYFGGGTAAAYLPKEDFFIPKPSLSDRFEDGTVSFLDIIALNHGFNSLEKLTGGMQNIQRHTFGLARYAYVILATLQHANGKPVVRIYSDTEFEDPSTQGAIINFNILDDNGNIIGYSKVDKLASLHNIHLRTGCFCNMGACQLHLGISNQGIKKNLQAGHICGDNIDIVDGQPTGSVRISFGYMSTFEDVQTFLKFIVESFARGPVRADEAMILTCSISGTDDETSGLASSFNCRIHVDTLPDTSRSRQRQTVDSITSSHQNASYVSAAVNMAPKVDYEEEAKKDGILVTQMTHSECADVPNRLTNIFLYPIKSCGAFQVTSWPVGPRGLKYDRSWMVVNLNGVCLSQKQEPQLCQIIPYINLRENTLTLRAPGINDFTIPLDGVSEVLQDEVFQSKVCGDRVKAQDCGDEVASWLSLFLGRQCRLLKQCRDFARSAWKTHVQGQSSSQPAHLSLANEAQYLLINRASVLHLQHEISKRNECIPEQTPSMEQLIARFRANFVIQGAEPFEEDNWTDVHIGGTSFQVVGQCTRCQMICIDQSSGTKNQELLQSLSSCRDGKIAFGVYLLQNKLESDMESQDLLVGCPVFPKVQVN
ncbi:molybdenum cofactor sulfurase-like [Polypterus senegalus]|uniref:molybdenum cofactor sulfurase-like n=1 Tax=Polypterus senegalus TaxID=55291 RepID=UPI001965BC73|nr:molybdenum cofactor sulfurase-like [Polypterus senegalus]